MRSLLWTLGLMLVANTAFAQFPGSQPTGPGFGPQPFAPSPSRIGVMFEYQTAPGAGAEQLLSGAADIGIEYSAPIGSIARYHLSFLYSNCSCGSTGDVGSANGFKIAPLGFGWAFPVYKRGPLRVELEGVVSFFEFQLFTRSDGEGDSAQFMNFSTGLYGQVTLSYGPVFFSLAPIGADFSWFTITTGTDTDTITNSGFSPEYRFQVSGGLNF